MLEVLNDTEKDLIRRSLLAACDGSFFPEWEFRTLFGLERSEMRKVLSAFPDLDASEETFAAINNSMFHLVSYPHNADDELRRYGLDASEVVRVHKKFRGALGKPIGNSMDFLE